MTIDPRMAFENLFGEGGTPEERQARQKVNRSILDWISHDVARLQKDLGAERPQPARTPIWTTCARSSAAFSASRSTTPAAKRGHCRRLRWACRIPTKSTCKLMFDLQVLAFMTDTTRVSAFKMSRDVSGRVCPESGVKTPFHPCSHHGENPAKLAEFAKLNRYHVSLLPYFLDKLKNTPMATATCWTIR